MTTLIIHPDAEDDLNRLWLLNRWAASRLIVLLQEFQGDEDLLDRLSQNFFHREPPGQFDVQYWVELRNTGRNVFRLKVWDANDELLPYRIIYAYKPKEDEYHVLAIAPREWNYDLEHKLSKRILQAYDEL